VTLELVASTLCTFDGRYAGSRLRQLSSVVSGLASACVAVTERRPAARPAVARRARVVRER
jgi:hypothetical protein